MNQFTHTRKTVAETIEWKESLLPAKTSSRFKIVDIDEGVKSGTLAIQQES